MRVCQVTSWPESQACWVRCQNYRGIHYTSQKVKWRMHSCANSCRSEAMIQYHAERHHTIVSACPLNFLLKSANFCAVFAAFLAFLMSWSVTTATVTLAPAEAAPVALGFSATMLTHVLAYLAFDTPSGCCWPDSLEVILCCTSGIFTNSSFGQRNKAWHLYIGYSDTASQPGLPKTVAEQYQLRIDKAVPACKQCRTKVTHLIPQ